MKNEFILAFNEICEARGLPKEDVFEALRTALVSAYRRDLNLSNSQKVTVEIDPRTGEATIFSEKEVVDEIYDNRTEVLISQAHKEGHTDAEMGDLVMVDSTMPGFGRIAAQTAKQVLLQRVREAEREHLYEDFSEREGELVNGTVQSVSGQHITIGLGRTEALLPRSQQVQGERYRAHDKIRVYVLEVRRTNRGPQIFVSRNHRNLLRRLLELEVPEIYNGQVEIKSIAREAGQRSKVAVQALQSGVDPVGACVGMRGVRIQSIVRELNDEKIDVIEWDPDQVAFIAKALSPARVSHVFLEEHPEAGKTAVVIVPDDQLSLAIGREGQNARLAAKLTGWRIDIKSLTEAAGDSLSNLDNPVADERVVKDEALHEQVKQILAKKAAKRPITSEDYHTLDRLVRGVEGRIIQERATRYEEIRKRKAKAEANISEEDYNRSVELLELPVRIYNLLVDNDIHSIGEVAYNLAFDATIFTNIDGFGEKALDELRANLKAWQAEQAPVEAESTEEIVDEVEEEAETEEPAEEVEAVVEETAPEPVVEEVEAEVETAVTEESSTEEVDSTEEEAEEEADDVAPIDDLSKSLVSETAKKKSKKKEPKKPKIVVVSKSPSTDNDEDDDESSRRRRGRRLVFDEDLGEVVTKKKRKGSRSRPAWEDYELDDDF